jgi:hypothetical protein
VVEPLAEAQGQIVKAKRPESPAVNRWVQLPPSLADLYEAVLAECDRSYVLLKALQQATADQGTKIRAHLTPKHA